MSVDKMREELAAAWCATLEEIERAIAAGDGELARELAEQARAAVERFKHRRSESDPPPDRGEGD